MIFTLFVCTTEISLSHKLCVFSSVFCCHICLPMWPCGILSQFVTYLCCNLYFHLYLFATFVCLCGRVEGCNKSPICVAIGCGRSNYLNSLSPHFESVKSLSSLIWNWCGSIQFNLIFPSILEFRIAQHEMCLFLLSPIFSPSFQKQLRLKLNFVQ